MTHFIKYPCTIEDTLLFYYYYIDLPPKRNVTDNCVRPPSPARDQNTANVCTLTYNIGSSYSPTNGLTYYIMLSIIIIRHRPYAPSALSSHTGM